MTYISAEVTENRKNVMVWERDSNGERDYRVYPAPYYFYIPDNGGNYQDIHGNKLTRMDFNYSKEFWETKEECKAKGIKLYESDISPEFKILSEHYYNKPIGSLNVTFFDIEVDKDPKLGYATIDNPYAPVVSFAIYHQYSGRSVVYAVPPDNSWTMDKIPQELLDMSEVVLCKDERQLLKCFLAEIENSDVISGWNNSFYDDPYIYVRILRVLGEEYARKMSFQNARPPKLKEVERFGTPQKTLQISGRVSIDYLELFRKLEQEGRPSYTLESISEELLPHLPKLEYEGSLDALYRNDFLFFLRYNIRDTEILKGFENRLQYVEFAIDFSHRATGLIDNILGTVKLSELTIINYCHYDLGRIVPDTVEHLDTGGKYAGALVLDPQVGMHEWVSAIDVESLYPTAIRSLNISPETIIGQFIEKYKAYEGLFVDSSAEFTLLYEDGRTETRPASQWKALIRKNNWNISGYGTIYDQNIQGFIPAILTEWFIKRKEYKAEIKKLTKELANLKETDDTYAELKRKIAYFDKMQYVMKIRLNSIYGCLGNQYFKFYDIRNAESTTRSGREILMHMVRKVAETLDGGYMFPSKSIIYGDTDSCYFTTNASTLDDAIKIASNVTDVINASFKEFTHVAFQCNDKFDNLIRVENEFVSQRSIFVKKKLYVLHLDYKEGKFVDKMKIMGLQLKKTTIPKPVGKRLTKFVEELLKGREFTEVGKEIVSYKDELLATNNILEIGLPKGIKGIEDYTERYNLDQTTLLPGHVAASMFWNKCIEEYNDLVNTKISSGMKIRVFYFQKTFGRFKSIAVPADLKALPEWFIKYYHGIIDRQTQVTKLVDDPLENLVAAIGKIIPTKKSLLVDELVEY